MGHTWLEGLLTVAVVGVMTWVTVALLTWYDAPPAPIGWARRVVLRVLPRRPAPVPDGRPLEVIARDARRLCARFEELPDGTSYAKREAVRHAYDRVLGEACAALGLDHLLGVLPPGEELDTERARVEALLWVAGFRVEPTP